MGCGAFLPFQELTPGKKLLQKEADLDDELIALSAEDKLERVSSFRQLQGISHQISVMTKGRDHLSSFKAPEGTNVRPVGEGEQRCVQETALKTLSFIKTPTGQLLPVVPDGLENVMLLLLQLDHGSIGSAGISYVEYELGWLITGSYDKIHRCIRSLKTAASAVPVFQKTKLHSAYLYSINKRPFGSGAFATSRHRLMECFQERVTIHHPVFIKYLPRLGHVSHRWPAE